MSTRFAALVSVVALSLPAVAQAQWSGSPGYTEGLNRGVRAGEEDSRRGQSYNFTDESDYRSADAGYRSQYGSRDRYRDEFRRGYEAGYRSGYSQGRSTPPYDGRYDNRGPNRGPYDPRAPYGNTNRDLAAVNGFHDGYERGLDDGHDRRRFDPVGESRYRNGDRGYERWYGPREAYEARYRQAFLNGYEQGYQDGRRYNGQRPWWWPF